MGEPSRDPVSAQLHSPDPYTQRPFTSHFIESVVLTWTGNALRVVVGLIALRVVTTSVPENALGAYWILTSVSAFLGTCCDLGVGMSAVRHLPLVPTAEQRERLMQTILLIRVPFLVVVCLAVFAFKPWVLGVFNAGVIADRYYYVYVFVVLNSMLELHTNFLQGLNRFRVVAALALVSSLGRFALILVFVLGLDLGVSGVFGAEALALTASLLISMRLSGYGPRLHASRADAKRYLGFGLPLYANTLLAYAATRLNMLMVAGFSGPVAVSHFTVAARIPDQVSMMLRSYNAVFLPNMTHLSSEPGMQRARHLLGSSLRVMGYAFALAALALSFFRRELMHLLAPDSYQVAAAAIPLLLGGLTFASLGGVLGLTLVALGDSRTPMKINLWTTLFSLVLNLILIPRWGLLGAAWALFAFNVLGYVVTERVVARRVPPPGLGYLGVLVAAIVAFALGAEAGVLARLAILGALALGPVVAFGALRRDLRRILAVRRAA